MLPFFLRPHMPKEGKYKGDGTPESRVGGWLKRLNDSEGPAVHFTGKCDTYPNTESYQVAMAYLLANHGPDAQNRASAAAFAAYYRDGIYIGTGVGDVDLLKVCQGVVPDIDADAFLAELKDAGALQRVKAQADELKERHGVSGVPFFLMNGKPAFSGAQDPATFVQAFALA